MLASSLTFALPKFIGDRIILKKMREYMLEVIDMQSGRVRYDFAERLDKSKLDFRWEMLQRIEATIEGISTAIEKGMSQRSKGEKEVEEGKSIIVDVLQKLNGIMEKLLNIKKQVEDKAGHHA